MKYFRNFVAEKLVIMILDKSTAEKKMRRMAMEIAERNHDKTSLILIGIKENGIFIASKIAEFLMPNFAGEIVIIELSMDKRNPGEIVLSKSIDFNNKSILLIDDVANSGSTMLYAMKPLLEFHPAQIETVILVERTHKKFPVAVNYVGLSVATTQQENIIVEVESGIVTKAYIVNSSL
jgi:pyrimidine operon attenuation protein/uracil phosphoribosyltransferase